MLVFGSNKTEKFYNGEFVKQYPSILKDKMKQKLFQVIAATCLEDLKIPPSNNLEKTPSKQWEYSIRITLQWRICFDWDNSKQKAYNIEITNHYKRI